MNELGKALGWGLCSLCLIGLSLPGSAGAQEADLLPDPRITRGFAATYRTVMNGDDDAPFLQVLELSPGAMGSANLYNFRMTMNWPEGSVTRTRSLLRGGEGLRSVSTLRTDLSAEGRELQREEMLFGVDPDVFPRETYSNFAIYFALQGMAASGGGNRRLFMAVPSAAVVRLEVACAKREWVRVAGGRFPCVKIVARTDLGYFIGGMGTFLNFVGYAFIPKSVLWYMEEDPHLLVKYRGMVLASPRNVPMKMELVRWSWQEPRETRAGLKP